MNPSIFPTFLFKTNKPSSTTSMILITSILLNIFIYFNTTNKWFPLILTLFFSGSILILFSLFTSISPHTKIKNNPMTPMWLIIIPLPLILKNKTHNIINNPLPQMSFQMETSHLFIITNMMITILFLAKSQTTKTQSPLKSSS